ncbi:hypothetical protein [Leptospira meyeri]|uniref:hypothetical protein n=1 Tax=Leptospira meyeri TaxID=29508 RepID=UPI0002C01937|nr:hypothetical protein [Leptospira meyeri]EMJ85441.1 hypothetical protein LEP1GSC196_2604 [Leptospira meyeri serovar Semaranga str. Veldrot Semarang 173]
MEDLIITEVRKIKAELEQENKNDFELILKKHQSLHKIYKSRIVEKDELDRKSKTPSLK